MNVWTSIYNNHQMKRYLAFLLQLIAVNPLTLSCIDDVYAGCELSSLPLNLRRFISDEQGWETYSDKYHIEKWDSEFAPHHMSAFVNELLSLLSIME
jgi:hypothetical protein